MLSIVNADGSTLNGSLIDEIVREGARRMPAAALEAEVNTYIAEVAEERDESGRRLVVRNGYHQPRKVTTAAGSVEVNSRAPCAGSAGSRHATRTPLKVPGCGRSSARRTATSASGSAPTSSTSGATRSTSRRFPVLTLLPDVSYLTRIGKPGPASHRGCRPRAHRRRQPDRRHLPAADHAHRPPHRPGLPTRTPVSRAVGGEVRLSGPASHPARGPASLRAAARRGRQPAEGARASPLSSGSAASAGAALRRSRKPAATNATAAPPTA